MVGCSNPSIWRGVRLRKHKWCHQSCDRTHSTSGMQVIQTHSSALQHLPLLPLHSNFHTYYWLPPHHKMQIPSNSLPLWSVWTLLEFQIHSLMAARTRLFLFLLSTLFMGINRMSAKNLHHLNFRPLFWCVLNK